MTAGACPAGGDQEIPIVRTVGLLFELTDHLRAQFAVVSAGLGVSFAQARTLLRIDEPVAMRELAARLRYDASNMTGIVEGLHTLGLVERQTSTADRRVKRIALTEQGVALRERLRARLAESVPAIGGLSASDRRTLHEILMRAMART